MQDMDDGAKRCAASFALFQTMWSFADVDGDDAVASLTWYVLQICQKSLRIGCVILRCNLQCVVWGEL